MVNVVISGGLQARSSTLDMSVELIGRERELAAIATFLGQVPSGPVSLAIDGEAGMGKSRLWLEAVRLAEGRGYRVLRAVPAEQEAHLSFAALGDLIGDVFIEAEPFLPEPQRAALRAALLLGGSEAAADPRTIATGLVSVVLAVTRERPIVIAIDDAQWLDRASERALDFAVRRLPKRTGVILARRPASGGETPGLAAAMRETAATHIQLEGLSQAGLHRLIAAEAPTLPTRDIKRVATAAGGNPLHALEIARAVRTVAIQAGDQLPVPASLQGLLRERLDRLSGHARAAATAVAISFRPTRATVVSALGPTADVDGALLEAEDLNVLTWDGERLRFSHPLLGAALMAGLSTGRRRALHRRLADAVDDPEERAHHLVGSIVGEDHDAARTIELGAEAAERRGAVDAAAELFLAAAERTPMTDVDGRARRTIGGARASFTAGDFVAARDGVERALAITTDGSLRARALVLLASIASYAGTTDERIAAHEAALAEASDNPEVRAQVLSVGVRTTVDPWLAIQHAQEAARLLRAAGDHDRLAQALINEVMASAALGLGAPAGLVEQAIALEATAGRRTIDLLIWSHWMDDVEGTRSRYERQVELATQDGDDLGVAELAEFMAMVQFRAGRWQAAEQLLEDACVKLGDVEQRGPLTASFADRSVIDAHRGRLDRARGTLRTTLDGGIPIDQFWVAVCLSALGAVEFVAGDLQAADRAWTAMEAAARSVGWLEFVEDRSEPDHIEALLALGDRERARATLAHLEWRGQTIPRLWIDGTLPRARALVMAADGRLIDALASIEAAPVVDALPFERARLLMVKGQLQRRANRRLAARASLEAALATFERLGSPPWVDRARNEISRLGLRHRAPNELTAMERRIAELAATGLTNRQVADAAFVSSKTVEASLGRVYGKLGIRSRAELGARMAAESSTFEPET